MELSILPPVIFTVGPLQITSGHLALLLITVVLIIFGIISGKRASMIPSRSQVIIELIFNWFYDKVRMSTPLKYQKMNFYLVITMFLMILFSNFFSFLPVLTQITYEGKQLFFTPTAHLSLPLVLGIFIIGLAQVMAFVIAPLKHIGNYLRFHEFLKVRSVKDFFMTAIDVFLGLMDIIGEIAKVVSISNRLFGNMISGILMATVIMALSFYTQFLAPVPFYLLGFLAALIQAIVFALLAALFFGSTLQAVMGPDGPSIVKKEEEIA